MNILAVETSTPTGSVAIITNNGTTESTWDRQQSHAEIITKETEKLLHTSNLQLDDIDLFACGVGPGSFTGIRVALNYIRALAYCYDKPVVTLSSLELLALPALRNYENVFCMQSAFRNLFYVSHYHRNADGYDEILEPKAWTLAELEQYKSNSTIVVGEAFEKYKNLINKEQLQDFSRDEQLADRPRASSFQYMNLSNSDASDFQAWSETRPLYIRASEAEEKLRKGLLKPL